MQHAPASPLSDESPVAELLLAANRCESPPGSPPARPPPAAAQTPPAERGGSAFDILLGQLAALHRRELQAVQAQFQESAALVQQLRPLRAEDGPAPLPSCVHSEDGPTPLPSCVSWEAGPVKAVLPAGGPEGTASGPRLLCREAAPGPLEACAAAGDGSSSASPRLHDACPQALPTCEEYAQLGEAPSSVRTASGRFRFEMKGAWKERSEDEEEEARLSGRASSMDLASRLRRFGSLADSDTEVSSFWEETPTSDRKKRCAWESVVLASPGRPARLLWDFFGAALIFYDLFKLPMETFSPPDNAFSEGMDWFILCFWTLNVLASLTVGYVEHGVVVLSMRKILLRYLRTWFAVDLVVLVPDWTFKIVDIAAAGSSDGDDGEIFRLLRVLRLIRMVRLLRLLKLRKIFDTINDMIDSEYVSVVANLVKMILMLLVVNHLICCMWYTVSINQSVENTWIKVHNYDNAHWTYSSYVVCDGCSRWRYCKNITSRGDLCICGKNIASLVPHGHVFREDDGGWLAAQPQGGTSPRISWADGWQPGGGAGGKGQGGQRQPPPHDKTADLKAAAAAAYSKLNKDDPLRQHYEALWPELAAAKPPADQPVAGFKAVEAAARRLDKLQKKVRSAGEQVESAQQYLAESERKLREAMEASIAAEDEFDKLKATVGKQEAPAEPAAEKPTLAALLEHFEHEPDDFHKWSEPDKEVWRAAKAKGERMAQTVKEHEEETAKHLRLLEEETARHREQLRQLEQPLSEVPPHALRQQGQLERLRPPAPQQLPNLEQAQQNMTKQKNAEQEWRPTSRRRERRSRRQGAPRQSSTQKGRATTQRGSRSKASVKKARRPCRIDFFNVKTWGPQAQGYLMKINDTKDSDIIGIAEHHLRQPAQRSKARAALRRNGMHSYWTKARPGEGEGTRGGTCAIARGSLDIQDRIAGFDELYLHEDGSDVTVVTSNLHMVRFAVAFAHLECGICFGERNVDILCDLRGKMAVWGGPWAALGDFNMAPSELNNSIWPRVLNVQVAAAEDGAPTCFPAAGEARCIDFALISQGLAPYFDQLELLRAAPWKPHIGIRLKLKGRPLMLKGGVLRRPAAIKPPVTVEKMPKSRAACRRAARGGQEAMRRRQQALAEAGCDLNENDMEPAPQLYFDKEVQHVISDELWQATSERVSVRANDELPQHLQHTVVGKMMERDMLDLGQQYDRFASILELSLCESIGIPEEERGRHLGRSRPPSYKSVSIKDTVTSTPWAGVERKIHAWWAEISNLARQLSNHDARAQEAAASRLGKTLAIPDEYSGGEQGPSAPEPGPVMAGSQEGRNTMDIQDHDPFEDEEDYLEHRQEIADQEYSDGNNQHTEGQRDSREFGQTDRRRAEGPHQREWEDYVAMRDDLEYWAAIWMDNLVQPPADNSNWMQVCVPFLETILGGGGNDGMVRLLRRRCQQAGLNHIVRDLCERARTHSGNQTQQHINTRRQLAQQLNQPDPGRLNEEGAAKDQQQALLTDLRAIAEGALVDPGTISRVAEEVKSMAKQLTKAVKKAYIHWVHDAAAGSSAKTAHAYTKAAERSHLEDILEHEGQVINHPQQLVDLRKEAWQRRWTRDAQKAERIQEALAKLRQAALAQENALEPISKDIIGPIIQHLKRNAGQGADWWRAPELKAMGAQGLEDFVQCLTSCEQRAAWPWQFYLVLELLLGKKPGIGGERPIGLMPMPYRIWSAARRPIVATWSKAAAGFWDTAVAGSSALRVAMHRLTRAEAATEMGFHAAGVFYDAANFYDNIGLDQLIEKASDLQCPLLPLAMAVQMYLAPRAIMAHSLFSDIFEPANSMVAGCGQAVDLTRPLLHGILDAAHRHHIFVVMQQYLDDLALQVEGARRQVIDQIKYVAALVHDGFKQLSIPISVKTAVVASDKDLQAEVASILDSLGTPNKQPGVVRDLGVDTSLGKQLRRPTHAARQAKAKQRVAKLKDLAKTGARGAAKVYSAGAYCQQAWDLPAHGITPTEARAVRATEAARLTGGHKAGRCTSTILLIQRGMQEAVTRAIGDQIKQFWLTIVDHPTDLKRYQRGWLLLYAKLNALEPNRRAANLNIQGGDTCARCGEAIETEEHRYYACPANAEIGHSSETDLAKKAKVALDQRQDLHFWLRGIPPAAWAAKVDPDEDAAKAAHIFCTSEEAQAAAQAGYKVRADYVFTDGSGGAGETAKDPRLRRCGWAVVAFRFDEQGRPQEVAAWYGTIRAPHTVPRAELTATSKAIGYTTAATARGLNIVSDCKYALDALKQIRDPEDLDYRSTNYDLWLQTKQQLQNSTDTIMGHHIPSHLIEHPAELERWNGPTWWVIGNEMADKYAGWGAEHGALDPAIIAQQQTRDQIIRAVQSRLLAINMAVSGPAKGQIIKDWLVETGECLGEYGGHQDQHGNVRLDFKAVQIGTQVVDVSHKTQFTHGWPWCEKCGGTSYLGDHKSRIVAGVARELARPCQPPTAAGRRVLADMQRGKLPRGAKPAADPGEEGFNEITMPGDFKLGMSNHEVIDLDGDSSEAGGPQPAPQQPPSHPHSVVQASWRLVDHMEGYAELWMNMVDQEVWDDMGDWMEHCVPYLLAITNVGGRMDSQEQTRAVTVQELQQIKDCCEEVWRNTHRKRRRLMTRMLTLPYGTRQQVARVHMDALQNRRNNILAHSIPSSERRPLPSTAEASREWSPENLDDDDSTPDSEAPEQEGEPRDQEMETMAGPDQRSDTNSLMQSVVQVAVKPTKPVGPDLMKFAGEAGEAGLLHPMLRHKREADQGPEQEVAWLERNRLEQHMQSLAGCWIQKEGKQGWPSWQAACVPHVLRELQTGVYQWLFSHESGLSRQRSQRQAAEEICRMAWLNSGEARRQSQQLDPKEAERRKAIAEQFLGRSFRDMAALDHFHEWGEQ
ncbi:unnamed protein product [Prorocentrum cordatum]|uniref:RNase H type-1 domain-containing protein n=1 Tax=Prorocentrum cordatum TaxID=2364126 RepID=A0ABN9Y8N7_9DINO|nr:unnamed protein product [Polarella glacialis]